MGFRAGQTKVGIIIDSKKKKSMAALCMSSTRHGQRVTDGGGGGARRKKRRKGAFQKDAERERRETVHRFRKKGREKEEPVLGDGSPRGEEETNVIGYKEGLFRLPETMCKPDTNGSEPQKEKKDVTLMCGRGGGLYPTPEGGGSRFC